MCLTNGKQRKFSVHSDVLFRLVHITDPVTKVINIRTVYVHQKRPYEQLVIYKRFNRNFTIRHRLRNVPKSYPSATFPIIWHNIINIEHTRI